MLDRDSQPFQRRWKLAFGVIDLDKMLVDRILEFRLFPCNADFPSSYFFECDFGSWWDIQAKLVDKNFVGSLTNLPRTV
jgi:hypothetical protein